MKRTILLGTLALLVSLTACGDDDDDSGGQAGAGGSGQAGSDSAGTGGGAGASASLKGFLEACEADQECTTGVCFDFTAKGKHCSKACTQDSDCESPSPGCNGMGYCRLP